MRLTITMFFSFLTFLVTGQSIDKGIGIIFLNQALPTVEKPKSDTMIIYFDKNMKAIVSKFTFYCKDRFKNEVISKSKISLNACFEFDYEAFGLPISSVDSTSQMVEVIYGYNGNEELKGWVRVNDKKVGYYLWNKHLMTNYLFFKSNEIKFYESPSGKTVDIKLAKSNESFDYIMKPLKASGNWMLVKLVTPSDYCQDPKKKLEKELWIKYLSNTGRPLVWYYTRGC